MSAERDMSHRFQFSRLLISSRLQEEKVCNEKGYSKGQSLPGAEPCAQAQRPITFPSFWRMFWG